MTYFHTHLLAPSAAKEQPSQMEAFGDTGEADFTSFPSCHWPHRLGEEWKLQGRKKGLTPVQGPEKQRFIGGNIYKE